jgi:hypothetical protein
VRLPPMGVVQFREVLCNLLLRAGPEDFAYEAQWLGGHQAVILRQMIDFSSLPARVVEASGVNLRLPDAAESARHQIQEELMRLAVRP